MDINKNLQLQNTKKHQHRQIKVHFQKISLYLALVSTRSYQSDGNQHLATIQLYELLRNV